MRKLKKANLRQPRTQGWTGLTIGDALDGVTHLAINRENWTNLLTDIKGKQVAMRYTALLDDVRESAIELSVKNSLLLTTLPSDLIRELGPELCEQSLLAFNGAETFGELSIQTSRWPKSHHCLETMVRILENGSTTESVPHVSHPEEIAAILKRYDPSGVHEIGNPTRQLLGLYDALVVELARTDLLSTYQLEYGLIPVTHRMCQKGIGVNKGALDSVAAKHQEFAEAAASRLRTETRRSSLNPDDNEAVLAALQGCDLSIMATHSDALAELEHPAVVALQQYRAAHTIHTDASRILESLDSNDRFHPDWDPLGTSTGRYSCSNPPFQSLADNPELRGCIVPRRGNQFIRCDYAQADLRPLAQASRDRKLIEIFNKDGDVYRETARALLGRAADEVSEENRDAIKAVTMGILYGMGDRTLAATAKNRFGLKWSAQEAGEWRAKFLDHFSDFQTWYATQVAEARTATDCRSLHRRRRQILPSGEEQVELRTRQLVCMIGQGTVADALKQAMVNIYPQLNGKGEIIANIHDELLVEARDADAQEVSEIVERGMIRALREACPNVKIAAKVRMVGDYAG